MYPSLMHIGKGALIDQTIEDVKQAFDTNTFAILRVAKTVIPLMAKRRTGVIVNIGSIVGEIPTPWNGAYCASKAALQSISDVLSMECKPFNISVLHVAPGGVQTNIADNASARFSLPDSSMYKVFLPNILRRIRASQAPGSMPAHVFAKEVVAKTLRKNPPLYMSLGSNSTILGIFKWLPKTWVLWFMWRIWSKKSAT
ncbi:hypothetical protein C0991_009153 [Blastosporella zonata]|nr:hypothetical protein C0991_009153 [Blastosporella zonata]